jgi:hypothetical protein
VPSTRTRIPSRNVVVPLRVPATQGYGYMREYPISHAFADARFLEVMASAYSNPRETLATSRPLAGAFRLDVKT